MEYALLIGAVAGVTEFIKRLFDRDYRASVIILAAALVGGLFGATGVEAVSIAEGVVAGLAASGVVTIATKVG